MKDFPPTLPLPQPWPRRRLRAALCASIVGMVALGAPRLHGQTAAKAAASSAPAGIAAIKSIRMVQEKDGPAIEILSSKPLLPSMQTLSDPARLVIDLPNARLDAQPKRIEVQADQIGSIRADQFQENPPIARVVVDLLAPLHSTWDAAGNRLVVHLGRNPNQANDSPFQPVTVPSLTPSPPPLVTEVRAAGPLALGGNGGGGGTSITAGPDTAVVNLSGGGEVRVCPGTTVSLTPSQNRHNLMLGMNTGALETHFALDASSDSVMTPDFRILLVGPGQFHYAVSADNQGNTCVRALPGNTASAMVTELLGDRTYQVKASDQLVFHSGQLDRVDTAVPLECGCPPPHSPPLRATNSLPVQERAPSGALPPVNANPQSVAETAPAESAPSVAAAASALDATLAPNELHVQVEAPLVFHATGPPPPAPVDDVRAPLGSRPYAAPPLAAPLPPPPVQKPASSQTAAANHAPARGFFKKLGGFFSSLFH